MITDQIYADLATLLHTAWVRVNWSKMGTSARRTKGDVFLSRIRRASYEPSLVRVLERVCKGLDVGALVLPLDVMLRLELEEDQVLEILRECAVLATSLAEQGPEALVALAEVSRG